MKSRRAVVCAIVLFPLTATTIANSMAQPSGRRTVIGLLDAGERPEWWDALRQQLRVLGYVEGRNVTFEQRNAKGNLDALPALAKELVQLNVAVIVTGGAAAAVAAKRATAKIPIVMASGGDQVSLGLAASLARPGGNVTGMSSLNSELMEKRFELMRETVPGISRVGALWHTDNPPSMVAVRDVEHAAGRSRVAFQSFGISRPEELSDAFSRMASERIEALIVIGGPFIYGQRTKISDLTLKHKIPAMYGGAEYAEAGGLLSYAASYPDLFRRAAVYVDKILKGANPGDMPIEQPNTFELVVNANTAHALGISIPASILARANRVIR